VDPAEGSSSSARHSHTAPSPFDAHSGHQRPPFSKTPRPGESHRPPLLKGTNRFSIWHTRKFTVDFLLPLVVRLHAHLSWDGLRARPTCVREVGCYSPPGLEAQSMRGGLTAHLCFYPSPLNLGFGPSWLAGPFSWARPFFYY
jgi:hypothetical protein